MESSYTEISILQFAELKQLDTTRKFRSKWFRRIAPCGQIEHLSGHADWVWSTNNLKELIGSQPLVEEELSLRDTMKRVQSNGSSNNRLTCNSGSCCH